MPAYWKTFIDGYAGYASYLWQEITQPGLKNYFYWLLAISLFFLILEWSKPWRQNQSRFRKDFWLDFFYMFFNFFLFSLIIYNAASDVIVQFFNAIIQSIAGFDLQASNPMRNWPMWAILLIGFFVRDFVQWWVHRFLHSSDRLWEFHKVHHSVEEMGFAAHLRYHWMETIVYRSIEYLPLALLGIGLYDFFIIHIFTLTIGHYNHANISVSGRTTGAILGFGISVVIAFGFFDVQLLNESGVLIKVITLAIGIVSGIVFLGPIMKKLFNHPEMHIWHHAYSLPDSKKYGVNFGISLAIWDYIFGTVYIPHSGKDIKIGFPGIATFPARFLSQAGYGFKTISKDPRVDTKKGV